MKKQYVKNLLSGCCKADIYEHKRPKYLGGSRRYCASCDRSVLLENNIKMKNTPPEQITSWAITIETKCVLIYKGTETEVKKYIEELIVDNENVVNYFEYNSQDYYYFIHGPLWKESI